MIQEAIDQIDEAIILVDFNDEKELGEALFREGMLSFEIPEELESFIDWEAIGRNYTTGGEGSYPFRCLKTKGCGEMSVYGLNGKISTKELHDEIIRIINGKGGRFRIRKLRRLSSTDSESNFHKSIMFVGLCGNSSPKSSKRVKVK
ncbi:hypothetical protein NDK43_26020 [Neobacillus pocheonensis]|uniref:Uncharacterized protein n=1 Tax=Neobacillus pocheonensis TaxID=363869 RepID=A0ABT0WFT2_9BACI|nr:hypothetical protein [Neobacillus pocheonensis]